MKQAWLYLIDLLRWRFSPKEWIGKSVYINGRCRNVVYEGHLFIVVEGIKMTIAKNRFGGVARPWVILPKTPKYYGRWN